jgi:DUF1365 family protein
MNTDSAILYAGVVTHRRLYPNEYRFAYRVFSVLLDIDRLDEADRASPIFSRNRFNLLSFYDRDHVGEGFGSLREWANHVLRGEGIDGDDLRIRLLCFPRVLGRVFNPLSLWYCETRGGRPRAVICEVRNTFGERHWYLLKADSEGGPGQWPVRASHDKDFHVSPFIGMAARYHFYFPQPGEKLQVLIRETEQGRLLLVASQNAKRQAFTTANLARQLMRVPLQTLKVLGAIHWHALKIWMRGTPFHPKPQAPTEEVS